jgi:hypothetical protein
MSGSERSQRSGTGGRRRNARKIRGRHAHLSASSVLRARSHRRSHAVGATASANEGRHGGDDGGRRRCGAPVRDRAGLRGRQSWRRHQRRLSGSDVGGGHADSGGGLQFAGMAHAPRKTARREQCRSGSCSGHQRLVRERRASEQWRSGENDAAAAADAADAAAAAAEKKPPPPRRCTLKIGQLKPRRYPKRRAHTNRDVERAVQTRCGGASDARI